MMTKSTGSAGRSGGRGRSAGGGGLSQQQLNALASEQIRLRTDFETSRSRAFNDAYNSAARRNFYNQAVSQAARLDQIRTALGQETGFAANLPAFTNRRGQRIDENGRRMRS